MSEIKIVSAITGKWTLEGESFKSKESCTYSVGSMDSGMVSLFIQVVGYEDGSLISMDVGDKQAIKAVEYLLERLKGN